MNERQLRQRLEDKGWNAEDIEDAVDAWAEDELNDWRDRQPQPQPQENDK